MKLKPILPYAAPIALGRRHKGPFVFPTKVKELPQFTKIDSAFNSYNRELRKKRFIEHPLSKAVHNADFCGNGSRGRMRHMSQKVEKAAGDTNIKKKPRKVIDVEIDAQDVIEQSQINFDGTEVRGKRTTNSAEAKAWIKKYGGVVKNNRGIHFTSGHFSGGKLRREYEASTKRYPSEGDNVMVDDEFKNLSEMQQEESGKIPVKDEGM